MSTEHSKPGFVTIERASYRYGAADPAVVDAVDWSIPRGEIHCLLGRSGCGKTTLLKLAAGLLMPSEGTIRIGGEALIGPSPRAGFVFQAPTLLDWLSALDNVLLPVSLKRRATAADKDAALDALTREELQDDLLRLCALNGTTALFVTHDIGEAVYLADTVAVMAAGRVTHVRRIELARPRHRDMRYALGFIAACRALRDAMDGAATASQRPAA